MIVTTTLPVVGDVIQYNALLQSRLQLHHVTELSKLHLIEAQLHTHAVCKQDLVPTTSLKMLDIHIQR